MKEIAAVLITFLGAISYFVVATRLALYQRWPVVHILICLAACVWLVRLVMGALLMGGIAYVLAGGLTLV